MLRNKQKSLYFLIGSAAGLVAGIYALTLKEVLRGEFPPRDPEKKQPEEKTPRR